MQTKQNLSYQSANELVAALADRKISAVELLEQTIVRIEQLDKIINAVVARDFAQARQAAKAADLAIARGERKPLLGLPMTVKESFNVAGFPTTWGNPQFKNWYPEEDALVVARLKAAGAIIIGKTNVPFMLADWQTTNPIYGTTHNPWNLQCSPGGSSGGSAAALAAGFVALELGSDMAGSIRVPANFCGVFGHRPSIHLLPMRGDGPPTSPPSAYPLNDLGVAGPMARTAADLALGLAVMAGPDPLAEGKGYQLALPSARHSHLADFRVLILDTHPLCPTSVTVSQSLHNLGKSLVQAGVKVVYGHQSIPDLAQITRTFVTLFAAFIAGTLPVADYQNLAATAKTLAVDDVSLIACYLRGGILSYRDWLANTRIRNALRQQWRNLYQEFDVVICPVMPTAAFPHNHTEPPQRQIKIDDAWVAYSNQYAWVSIAALFGLPATVMPIGFANGLPLGIQIIGDYL